MTTSVPDVCYAEAFSAEFFRRPTDVVARELLGALLVRRVGDSVLCGRIVETEAYLPHGDEANHAWRGCTARNAAMFEEGGVLYVYQIYGIHYCLNVVTGRAGEGCAVLIRAVEPLCGLDEMRRRRGVDDVVRLCNGPGKLAAAFGYTTADSFLPATAPDGFVQPGAIVQDAEVEATPRIGISRSVELPLRFVVKNSPFVSPVRPVGRSTGRTARRVGAPPGGGMGV